MLERSHLPKVSVLMSVFNGEEFLAESIESILTQTFRDFEFLIIDDGSTDDSVEIINSYYDDRIRLVRNTENIGLTRSLNKGIRLSKGELVVRMDADDISMPDRLEKLLHYMNSNPDVGVCGSWLETIGDHQEVWKCYEFDNEIKAQLLFCNAIFHPTVIIKKSCLFENNVFYDEKLRTAQDYGLWVALSKNVFFANIQEVLLRYRIHENKIGKKLFFEQMHDANVSRKRMLKYIGVDADSVDMDFHLNVFNIKDGIDGDFLDKSLEYFSFLISQNNKNGFIKYFCLEKILAEKWWLLCSEFSFFNLLKLLGVRKAFFKKAVDKGFLKKITFLNDCIPR